MEGGPRLESYVPRLLDQELAEDLTSHPAVLVVGPRACGKTTTTRRQCRSLLRLDVPSQAAVAQADPDAALRDLREPIVPAAVVPGRSGAQRTEGQIRGRGCLPCRCRSVRT
jgi:hypothetical protein